VLDALGAADDRQPRAQTGQAVGGGQEQDQPGVAGDAGRRIGGQRVDGALDRPRDAERERRGQEQQGDPERVTEAVATQVAGRRPGRPRGGPAQRGDSGGPSTNGLSAA
jgi:hypothetical protein